MVAGGHFFGPPAPTTIRCVAYTSADRGQTWSAPVAMPQLTAASSCSDPVLAYAPDGSRLYYAYMDIKQTIVFVSPNRVVTQDFDIVVSVSDDNGQSWVGPTVVLNGNPSTFVVSPSGQIIQVVDPGFDFDKPWIGTHVETDQSAWAYVSATRFNTFSAGVPPNSIAFSRSADRGHTWSPLQILDSGSVSPAVVVQGSRPAGGLDADVVVAWYQSGSDGWLQGSFNIRTRHSTDHGATFSPVVDAAADSFETSYYQGPLSFYKRWWPTMWPDIEIGADGAAHIVYGHDPVLGEATPESGDIRYITSSGAPYTTWTLPVTVNDDGSGRAQGFAALEVEPGHGGLLHAIWEDSRLAPDLPISSPSQCFTGPVASRRCDSPNLYYDIFYASKVPVPNLGWFSNFRVSEALSIQDFDFGGDYIDLAANDTLLFGIWTDRRHRASPFELEDNTFGSRIIIGGAAPQTRLLRSSAPSHKRFVSR
jgi:hypothetical protein